MFEGLDMPDLLGKVKEMQRNMSDMRERMETITVESEAGGGMVKVTANCNKRLVNIKVDPELLKDLEMMEDLICAAVNKTLDLAEEKSKLEMTKATSSFFPSIPGLDLSKFNL